MLQFFIDFRAFWEGFGRVWGGFGEDLGRSGEGLGRVWGGAIGQNEVGPADRAQRLNPPSSRLRDVQACGTTQITNLDPG